MEQLERANKILEKRVRELEGENKIQAHRISELEASRDFALALVPVLDALKHHDERAEARSNASLHVMQMIADRLGPDTFEPVRI